MKSPSERPSARTESQEVCRPFSRGGGAIFLSTVAKTPQNNETFFG